MPLSISPRALLAIIAAAVLAIGAAVAVTPAYAADGGVFYRAELAQPAAQTTVIADGVAWKCDGSVCLAAKSNSRDAIVCAQLTKKVGELTSFASRKRALEPADLARCNGNA